MGAKAGDSVAITLSMDQVYASQGGGSQKFQFRSDAGAQASFKDFTEFRIFDVTNQLLLGTAEVPKNLISGTPTSNNPTKPAQTTVSQASSVPTVDNSNQIASAPSGSMIGLGFLLAYILLF
jgi:hypothetical protein